MRLISVVIPVMDEALNIRPLYQEIKKVLHKLVKYEIIFVCDPSKDGSENVIKELIGLDKSVRGVFLADRAGQTESIRAGFEFARGDAIVSMDADFQDPPELIKEMIRAWGEGALIVHTKKVDRSADKLLYRLVTRFGYGFLSWITNGRIQVNVGDFRLIDRTILPILLEYKDPKPFWRGITSMPGVRSKTITYKRTARRSGKTKFGLHVGSPSVALRGIASFTHKPLELIQTIGFLSVFLSLLGSALIVIQVLATPGFPRGIPTIIGLICLFFSIQFFSTAIIATYLIVLMDQTSRRPNYVVLPDFSDKTKNRRSR